MTLKATINKVATSLRHMADVVFLALVIWREARGEPAEGRVAVAYCILNRVARPSWWGHDIMSVVSKKWQFSSMTDPKDVQLTTWPQSNDPSWLDCLAIASGAIDGTIPNPAPGADHYFDTSIIKNPPKWADKDRFVKKIGRIYFYDLDRDTEIQP